MYGALLLFESEFVHIVAISFTSLILTELLMVALTIQTWHWLMIVGELLSLSCYIASLVFLHEFIGEKHLYTSQQSQEYLFILCLCRSSVLCGPIMPCGQAGYVWDGKRGSKTLDLFAMALILNVLPPSVTPRCSWLDPPPH